jgi:hypothetical protein
MSIQSFNSFNEEKSEKWIKDAIKKPGSLRKSMKKKEGEKIKSSEIDSELQALKGKDKDKDRSRLRYEKTKTARPQGQKKMR